MTEALKDQLSILSKSYRLGAAPTLVTNKSLVTALFREQILVRTEMKTYSLLR